MLVDYSKQIASFIVYNARKRYAFILILSLIACFCIVSVQNLDWNMLKPKQMRAIRMKNHNTLKSLKKILSTLGTRTDLQKYSRWFLDDLASVHILKSDICCLRHH